jgi:hypothetical protein
MKVHAQKLLVDSAGNEHDVPMNDWVEIGLYKNDKGVDKPIYLQMHRIRSGKQKIKLTVRQRPDTGGIDPNHLMIDIRLDDNIIKLNP